MVDEGKQKQIALAEKYAKQLHDATQKIMELETEVADCEVRLEQSKAVHEGMSRQGNASGALHNQLDAAALRIKELEIAVTDHQDQLNTKQHDVDAMAKELQEQRAVSKEALEQCVSVNAGPDRVLRERRVVDAKAKNSQDATKAELRAIKQERTLLRRQVTNFEKLRESLGTKVATLTHGVDQVQRDLSDKEAEVRKMGGLLDREKKRRKCHPVIVDLEQHDAPEETISQPNGVQQFHQRADVTGGTLQPTPAVATIASNQVCNDNYGQAPLQVLQLPELRPADGYNPAPMQVRPYPGFRGFVAGWQPGNGTAWKP
ncbi:hypothetical protein B0A54_09910 [Friedmanniomyces endolithicus]|uniref:Uncharacterized protein n=1 Tax=Friedmanniomyces endolithicus TaxID=329885 RepID=A0A4U0US54_9PEZI|nr:hypothetical protein B0A54_09910 [Friedmanniomyces endolithicus]